MLDIFSWTATAATIVAAFMTASNFGSRITGFGFAIFTVGSLSWLAVGLLSGQPALTWTNIVLTGLNIYGIWRWLGRQAQVEQGSRAASEASADSAGEALFPVSLLTRGTVVGAGEEIGTCVDAMVGSGSGRIAYIAVSQGGVGGVGERLRRLPWSSAMVEEERVVANLSKHEVGRLEEFAKDSWPPR